MSLAVKDANTTTVNLSTQLDAQSNVVPMQTPGPLVGSVATPVSQTNPMPVINAAGSPAVDGSGQIQVGGQAQMMFGGVTPTHGYLVANTSAEYLWVSDVGAASPGGTSIPIQPFTVWPTPDGYKPPGPVSIWGGTLAQSFSARQW